MIGTSGMEGRKSTLVPSDGNFDVLYWDPRREISVQVLYSPSLRISTHESLHLLIHLGDRVQRSQAGPLAAPRSRPGVITATHPTIVLIIQVHQ
jgi:hypothetical protein